MIKKVIELVKELIVKEEVVDAVFDLEYCTRELILKGEMQ